MKNNQLIKTEYNIFIRIKNYFRKVFYKKNNYTNKIIINKNKEKIEIEKNNQEQSKTEFMNLYNKVKNNEILISALEQADLDKICKLMEEEIILTKKQIETYETRLKSAKNI